MSLSCTVAWILIKRWRPIWIVGDFSRLSLRVFGERELRSRSLRYMLSPVRLSVVCLSVTSVHHTQPVENFGKVSTPFGTLVISDDIHGKFYRDRRLTRCSCMSPSLVRPPTSSSFLSYASSCLWNLPASLRQPHFSLCVCDSTVVSTLVASSFSAGCHL